MGMREHKTSRWLYTSLLPSSSIVVPAHHGINIVTMLEVAIVGKQVVAEYDIVGC